jgi:C-terminal processing protease CtpA/Prc
MKKGAVVCCLILFACFICNAQKPGLFTKKIAPEKMRADMDLLKKILEANHPSLYWYTSKDSLDDLYHQVYNSLNDSLTELQFRYKAGSWVTAIKCGHTSVRVSKKLSKELAKNNLPQFPLQIKAWEDSMVVFGNAFRNDSILKRGTIITAINGLSTQKIRDSVFKIISTDGNSINHKNQVLSNSFPYWFNSVIGNDSVYRIHYYDSTGKVQTSLVNNYVAIKTPKQAKNQNINQTARPKPDSVFTNQSPVAQAPKMSKHQMKQLSRRSLSIDTANLTAIMRLNTFSRGALKLFFRRSFRLMKELEIKHLVIDLRSNGGGKVDNSTRLTQYLINRSFKIGDTVVAISRKFEYSRYIHPSFIYWVAMNFGGRKMEDGKIHYRRYEKHLFEPKEKNHFNGNLYLLQGGSSFSAATMFIAALKGQSNVKVIGEETGGGYYGNSAMHIPTIVLPNSNIRVGLPMYRLVMDKNRPKGGGIIPDISIPPSSLAIKAGIDLKMNMVRDLISKESNNK